MKQINYRLLRRIRDDILAEPLRFNMAEGVVLNDAIAPCNTTACIAGWAVVDNKRRETKLGWKGAAKKLKSSLNSSGRMAAGWPGVRIKAQRLLGLTYEQAERLFYDYSWPRKFELLLEARKTRKAKAKVAAARIDFFIQTKGTDVAAKR